MAAGTDALPGAKERGLVGINSAYKIEEDQIIFFPIRMDTFTQLFWLFTLLFVGLSAYLVCCTKRSNVFYLQIASGLGIFATSKIGRKFLGLA